MTNPADAPISPAGRVMEDGVWRSIRDGAAKHGQGRAALFLDRDGVINIDHGYVHQLEHLDMIEGAADLIRAANERHHPVIIVTNQSGIGRGYFDWAQFSFFQMEIEHRLAQDGARLDAIFACPHHAAARPPYDVAEHPARKPNPGMLLAAADLLGVDLATSRIVGDRPSDLLAGSAAGLAGGVLIGGTVPEGLHAGFQAVSVAATRDARAHIPLLVH